MGELNYESYMTIFEMLNMFNVCVYFQTLMHVAGIVASVGAFFGFALIYNAVCVNCMGLLCSYWVMEVAIGRYIFWLTIILTSVLAILPRYLIFFFN